MYSRHDELAKDSLAFVVALDGLLFDDAIPKLVISEAATGLNANIVASIVQVGGILRYWSVLLIVSLFENFRSQLHVLLPVRVEIS